jgi:hypothetical protein
MPSADPSAEARAKKESDLAAAAAVVARRSAMVATEAATVVETSVATVVQTSVATTVDVKSSIVEPKKPRQLGRSVIRVAGDMDSAQAPASDVAASSDSGVANQDSDEDDLVAKAIESLGSDDDLDEELDESTPSV